LTTPTERAALTLAGCDLDRAAHQLAVLRAPVRYADLQRPCTADDGISNADDTDLARIAAAAHRVTHFIPASGAATRMFAALNQARGMDEAQLVAACETNAALRPALRLYQGRRDLAFWGALDLPNDAGPDAVFAATLAAYADRPKGLVPFHAGGLNAAQQHVSEAAQVLGVDAVRMHYTVNPAWTQHFADAVRDHAGLTVDATFSAQDPATDTVAVHPDGRLFTTEQGHALQRPGGHGALIGNIDALNADVVLIKNVDNVVPDRAAIVDKRQRLLTTLLVLEEQVHAQLRALEHGANPEPILAWALETFGPRILEGTVAEQAWSALHRPLRATAVVPNEGHPGGGPFWTRTGDGSVTPQIVEGAQVDLSNPAQAELWRTATHFNPVDLACSVRDHTGKPYPLMDFVDDSTWIVTRKTKDGAPLIALERPGLWNGAMAHWNTVFVHLPAWIFNPVKTVADLLTPAHQG
jgi:hypothetical protein